MASHASKRQGDDLPGVDDLHAGASIKAKCARRTAHVLAVEDRAILQFKDVGNSRCPQNKNDQCQQ